MEKKAPAGSPTTDKGFLYIKKIQERHFSRKKKPLREAAQRIRGFYPEKKAPAGSPTTDMGFLYTKSNNQKKYKI